MNKLNDQNIDEIMFQLLEGEIDGKERDQLLSAIEADPKYAALWEAWQQTKLQIPSDIPAFNSKRLKRKPLFYLPHVLKYAVAAILVLALTFGIYRTFFKTDEIKVSTSVQPSYKNRIPQLKTDTSGPSQSFQDSFVPLKEKVRYIAKAYSSQTPVLEINKQKKAVDSSTTVKLVIAPETIHPKEEFIPAEEKKTKSDDLLVSIEYEPSYTKVAVEDEKPRFSLFQRLFGLSKVKLVNDSTTRTQKKIILENKKYQIIAGF